MKKYTKKDFIYIGIFIILIYVFVLTIYLNGYVFGSKIDWANQHTIIPDYFRKIFYSSGKLVPSLAINLGMGQNIFYFSYYGLLSPIVLISYILPFISMTTYIQIASILSLLISTIMFYNWIKSKYNSNIAFIVSLIFMLNGTFSYHFHRHIMFVIYMPFLIGALKSIDYYLKDNKPIPYILYIILLILTSYYFSVHSIIAIGLYTIYKLLTNKTFKTIKLFNIILYTIIGILITGILLIPTFNALTNGRIPTLTNTISLADLISPKTNYDYTFYNSYYSWGLTFIYIVSIIYGFISHKKHNIFLSSIFTLIILFPFCSYLLNALMYIDGKCFIPFLPLALLLVSEFIDNNLKQKINYRKLLRYTTIISLPLILLAINKDNIYLLISDIILMIITIFISSKKKNKYYLYIPTIIISLITFVISNTNETYLKQSELNKINNSAYYELSNFKDDENLYRISTPDNAIDTPNKIYNFNNLTTTMYSSLANTRYFNFYRNIFQNEIINRDNTTITQTNNLLFNIYSATKYLITENSVPLGYQEIKTINNLTLYKNNDIIPLAYATNKIMSKRGSCFQSSGKI